MPKAIIKGIIKIINIIPSLSPTFISFLKILRVTKHQLTPYDFNYSFQIAKILRVTKPQKYYIIFLAFCLYYRFSFKSEVILLSLLFRKSFIVCSNSSIVVITPYSSIILLYNSTSSYKGVISLPK